MPTYIKESDIAQFLFDGAEYLTPFLRVHIVGDAPYDENALLLHCLGIMVGFEPCQAGGRVTNCFDSFDERLTVVCVGTGGVASSDREHPLLTLQPVFDWQLAESFRRQREASGLWMLELRLNHAEHRITFAVDSEGRVISKYVSSETGIRTVQNETVFH